MTALTPFKYLFLDLRTCIGTLFRVWVLDLQPISDMYALGSWLVPSDEIRLYANDKQRSYTEFGPKTGIEPT